MYKYWKRDIILLFIDHIIYVVYPKESTKLLELFSNYNKVIAHKVDIQKLMCKNIYKADMILIKIPEDYSLHLHKIILKFL